MININMNTNNNIVVKGIRHYCIISQNHIVNLVNRDSTWQQEQIHKITITFWKVKTIKLYSVQYTPIFICLADKHKLIIEQKHKFLWNFDLSGYKKEGKNIFEQKQNRNVWKPKKLWKTLKSLGLLRGALSGLIWFENDKSQMIYLKLKALFVLKIFKFLSWLSGHIEKRLDQEDKVNYKIYDVTNWKTNYLNANIAQSSKGNQTMNFGQSIEYIMKHFSWKINKMWWRN